jgi:predicted glycosyltransferase
MRVWVDLANSPHVPLFVPIVRALEERGDDVVLSARDHAQTLPLARAAWPEVKVVGGESPAGRMRKAVSIFSRAEALRRFAHRTRPDLALSHGSYAQVVAARLARVPAVTMMDYEHQPANHLSFRLARRVIVPRYFPHASLRRFGARREKVVRYEGFKEELYLSDVVDDPSLLEALGLDHDRVTAAMRPPPDGALYHRNPNPRFDEILEHVVSQGAQVVLLPRTALQAERYRRTSVVVPDEHVDGRALLATVDLTVGAGGTMTRESALLGTPTYTVFAGELAAVDAELIREGRMVDLRAEGLPEIARRSTTRHSGDEARAGHILEVVAETVDEVAATAPSGES